ncbi:two-component system, NarL family, sensor histidine kinase EvgS [Thermoflexales bacterium]|nr:two-component system, NarL family, sensor histidine kinase EvgS [Thermoflexales bacterium]
MLNADVKLTDNRNKQAVQINLQLLPLIMNNIPQAVFWKDKNLVYLGCNQAFAEDADLASPEEIVGKTDFDMPWKDQAELYRADDRLVLESGESKLNYEEPQTTPDGSTTWLRTSKIPIHENDQIVAILGMYEDITAYKKIQQASEVERQRFQKILETVRVPTIISRLADGIVLYANQAIAQVSQVNLDKLIGFKTGNFYANPDDQSKVREALRQYGHIDDFEVQFKRTDGSVYWALLSSRIIEYEGEKCVLSTYIDISERKQAEQAIAESEERFRWFTEATIEGLIFHERGTIIDVNPAAVAMIGAADAKDLIGRNLLEFILPEFHQLVLEKMQSQTVQPYEIQCIHANGSVFPVETSTRAYTIGEREIRASSMRDITERQRAEAELQREKALSDAIINSLPGVFYMFDTEGRFVRWNKNYEKMLGMTTAEVANSDLSDGVAEEDLSALNAAVEKTLTENVPASVEAAIVDHSGNRTPYYFTGNSVTLDDQVYILGVGQDITERKRAETEVQREKALSDAIINGLPGVFYLFDTQGNMLRWNKQYEEVLGYTSEETAARNALDPIAAEDKERTAATIGRAFQEGQASVEASLVTKDGRQIPYYFAGQRLNLGDQVYLAGMGIDITERKKLEEQVQTAFERRGLQVQLSTQVSQSIAAASNLEELYERVVTQVKEQFGYYHTQLLRYDAAQQAVVLVTGYGEIGAKMLAAGHRLPMGEGLIGTAAASGETVLRSVLENDPDWHPNPLLPETKGEIAVPIKLADIVLGVLDVQSSVAGALDTDDQLLLEGLCGQIATAIEGTRLRQEMGERLEEINRLYRAMSREGWRTYREAADVRSGFMFDQGGLKPVQDVKLAEEFFALAPLTVPGGEIIGTLAVADDPQRPIAPEDQTFLQQVSVQVALALESARLFDQTQEALSEAARRAAELQTVAEVSATTATLLDPDRLLQAVVDLTKERFDLYHAHIYLADTAWQTLLLAAGTGEVGRKMVAEGHAIAVDAERSLVARAARERQAIIVNDVRTEPDFLPNPSLPETRSEMAVPIIIGDKVLGVFDVQADRQSAFGKEEAGIYSTLAAQVGVALQNARLYVEQASTVAQLRELDRLKSSFLANMSHELRTPLNSILGFSDVMLDGLDGPLTEIMENDLRLINRNGQHLLSLINDVLDMAKIAAGKMNLNIEHFNLHEVLTDVVNITAPLARDKALVLQLETEASPDLEIEADHIRLRQVMINLVANAIKFTETGGVTIFTTRQAGCLRINIRDTGIGVLPEQAQLIFEEFGQVDTSTTRKTGGTGLGLPISRKLIELHGGQLWVESSGVRGEGSTFIIELPATGEVPHA